MDATHYVGVNLCDRLQAHSETISLHLSSFHRASFQRSSADCFGLRSLASRFVICPPWAPSYFTSPNRLSPLKHVHCSIMVPHVSSLCATLHLALSNVRTCHISLRFLPYRVPSDIKYMSVSDSHSIFRVSITKRCTLARCVVIMHQRTWNKSSKQLPKSLV